MIDFETYHEEMNIKRMEANMPCIDVKRAEEARRARNAEATERFHAYLDSLNEREARKQDQLQYDLMRVFELEHEEQERAARREMLRAQEASEKEIYDKYRESSPSAWNDSPADRALREFARSLGSND